MDIDKLTIGEAKAIAAFLAKTPESNNDDIFSQYIGKYVIVRSQNEGVNAGRVSRAGIGFIELTDARRLWYHKPKRKSVSWYEGVALYGLSDDSKVSNAVSVKLIVEGYSITACSKESESSIVAYPTNEQ